MSFGPSGFHGEEPFYRPPVHGMRHPQFFYYEHTPCFCVNKLRVAGVLKDAVDPYMDSDVASTRAKQPRIAGTDVGYPDVMRVTSPTSVLDQYRWPKRFLQASLQTWGKDYVVDGLSMMSWKLSTTFSGMGCFESAALAVRENVQVFLRQNNRRESACIELRSALDFDTKDIVFFENTPGYEAVDFFWDKANGCPDLSTADKETIRGYRRTFGKSKEVFDLSQRNPAYYRTELVDDSMMALKTNTRLYCEEKHKRIMSAEEVCACLVLPCNKNFARVSKGPPFAVDSVNYNAIGHLVGNGMNAGETFHLPNGQAWRRSFNVDADKHPCQLVEKYMATTKEAFDLLLNNMNAWLVGNGVEALNLENFKFPKEDGPDSLPVLAFNMVKPTEGFPPLVQFQRWCESIWFSFEKSREPLEVHPLDVLPGERLEQGGVGLTKGFTRSSVILYAIIRTVMIEDPESFSDTEKEFFTTWLVDVLLLPVIYTDHPGYNLDTALNTAFEEYNNFGLARQSTQFSLENIRNGRWLVGSTGRGITPYWQAVETVTPGKQLLFMQRVLFTFNIRKKQVRSLSTARCTAEQWELMLETSCLAHQLLEDMKAAKDDAGAALFREADIAKARDYSSEIQNLAVAKVDFVAADLSFWQDNDAIKALDIESVQKAYQADLLKVSEDCSRFSEYLSKLTAGKRQHAIAKVLKLKAENRRGAQLVVDWMHRYAKFATNDYVEEHMNIVEAAGFIVAPTMVSSRVVAGKRGELRRVEDKLDTRSLQSIRVSIRMQPGHGNRRLPLLFPAWVAVNDSATSNIFGSSKMLVNECTKNEIPWLPVREYRVPRAKNMAPCTTEAADRMISYSCGPNVIETQYAQRLLAQKVVEDWRSGTHPLGNTVPKYSPELQDDTDAISTPELLVCEMSTDAATGDKKLILNGTLRGKWLDDPSRKDEWLAELAKFDARFGSFSSTVPASTSSSPTTPAVAATQPQPASTAPARASGTWAAEPTTVNQLEETYEVVLSVPGRIPTTQLKIVSAAPKGKPLSEASEIVPEQEHKLFIV
ncbi:hypothetical protein AK812_SmicGene34282 [Symbiodinium microadriaticum]|uniref:Uncharacterized protein n=1 Tax=Symbiodinium microadriaticum TaxID=2951 RepID=A0A1Q9CPG4_SYMMI|nr:hypothetical protein AK812_SmicGene34282 [Symbiodinium microadriaticum]CAE7762057.1 unnamed protein product [Symbiodinium sp. KB8]